MSRVSAVTTKSKNIINIKDILKSNKNITHIFIEAGTNEDALKTLYTKHQKMLSFKIASHLHKLNMKKIWWTKRRRRMTEGKN